ncbi:MAG: HdeD family acid-resistance protein [Proteobacteria bacterium]|nr:HdeD family acid-resistance protein [Pseudomonadota bacterium]
MSTPGTEIRRLGAAFNQAARRHWGLFMFEGIVLLLLGTLALLAPELASIAATVWFGSLLLVSGVVGLVATLRSRQAPGFGWSLLSAVVAIVAGGLLLGWPVQGTLSLTTVLIAFLFVEGVVSILYAQEHRREGWGRWGWMLASGIADLVLAAVLLSGLPGSAVWAIGLLLGINLIFGGWALIAMALHYRSAPTGAPAPG